MGFLAMATGRETFRMAWGRTGLADLIQVAEAMEHRLTLARNVGERFGAAQGGAARVEKVEDQLFGVFNVRLAVFSLARPTRTGGSTSTGAGAPSKAGASPGSMSRNHGRCVRRTAPSMRWR